MHMKQATGTVEDTHGKEIPHDSLKRAEQSSMQGGDMFWCCIARLKVSPHLTINLEDNINSGIIDQVIGYDAPINTYQFVLKSLRLNVPPGRLDSEWWWVYRECIISRIRPDSSDVFNFQHLSSRNRCGWGDVEVRPDITSLLYLVLDNKPKGREHQCWFWYAEKSALGFGRLWDTFLNGT